ncbi:MULTISPECIES: hypothetical protein [Candidatus Ichthyocystis]|uniref:hypothetical protein n=1 Tax=Candidatus Ichthyocystis TaxID=2929841 RepID=UPI000B8822FA|nr:MULTISPECIES: hypothetical protein [Ichthyocystis]
MVTRSLFYPAVHDSTGCVGGSSSVLSALSTGDSSIDVDGSSLKSLMLPGGCLSLTCKLGSILSIMTLDQDFSYGLS